MLKLYRWLLVGVHLLERSPRLGAAAILMSSLLLMLSFQGCTQRDLRMATYNLRHFGVEPKDERELKRIFSELNPDILAVQEVRTPERLEQLAYEMSGFRRSYRAIYSECAGRRQMHVGFIYDSRRTILKKTQEFRELLPENGGCSEGDRPGFLGVFSTKQGDIHALVVHLKAGGSDEDWKQRRGQLEKLRVLLAKLKVEGAEKIVLLGDMNSTGYLGNERGERDQLDFVAREAGLSTATAGLPCSEYYKKSPRKMVPSLLDHVLISSSILAPSSVQVHAHCQQLQCVPSVPGAMPPSYTDVSDHCPVSFRLVP